MNNGRITIREVAKDIGIRSAHAKQVLRMF